MQSPFFLSIAGVAMVLIFIAWWQRESPKHELVYIAIAVWFLVWVSLSRGAQRYDFFLGLSIAFFTAALIHLGASMMSEKLKHAPFFSESFRQRIRQPLLNAGIAVLMLAVPMFWTPAGAYTKRSIITAKEIRIAMPGDTPVAKAFAWMKAELPPTAVVAAHWSYGSQLNVLGGVKTVIDQDHYIQHWIHLFNRHVHDATDAREALAFLKTHGATHLMLTQSQPPEVFLQGELSEAFVPTYPTDNFTEAAVKVWRIHYPPDIPYHRKYLATEPGE